MDRRTPHGVRSAPVHRLCDADGARASGAAQKSRRHAMSRNEEFVTDGDPPRGATSPFRNINTQKNFVRKIHYHKSRLMGMSIHIVLVG